MESEKSDLLARDKATSTRWRLAYPEPVLFFVGIGFFSFIPLNQEYLYMRYLGEIILEASEGNTSIDHGNLWDFNSEQVVEPIDAIQDDASAEAAAFSTQTALFRCIPPIFTTLFICKSTDSFGRKFGIYLPIFGGIIRSFCYLAVHLGNLSLYWLFLGEFLDGVLGENATVLGCCFAFIYDGANRESLAVRFVICNAILSSGSGLGNLIVGQLVYFSFTWGILFIMVCYLCALLYVSILLPESLPMSATKEFEWSLFARNYIQIYEVFTKPRTPPSNRTALKLLIVGILLGNVALRVYFDLETVYMQGSPFNLDPTQIGNVFAVVAVALAFVPPLWTRVLKCCLSDTVVAIVVIVGAVAGYVIQAFCTDLTQLVAGDYSNAYYNEPYRQLYISSSLFLSFRGWQLARSVQASFSCASSIGELLSIEIMLSIYAATVSIFPGTTHLVIAGVLCICVGILMIWESGSEKLRQTCDTQSALDPRHTSSFYGFLTTCLFPFSSYGHLDFGLIID
ncbi:hypothetical protein CAPTEDRAFT_197347 [Capitella teleta]|uniref:Major facilitator superfamily (MFS) profile domain-containing protein n=1 Tax=Capitella teleta TaxID=283909 RepID=R7TW39_CAPTE|nr:hypothetical protein CAPTEDRAFT_197347 [Capitella teleta]|eukprot:ELT95671.1 hypothetical protein CAPTEDRAFT_197347 [Capitella teleta]